MIETVHCMGRHASAYPNQAQAIWECFGFRKNDVLINYTYIVQVVYKGNSYFEAYKELRVLANRTFLLLYQI